MAKRGETDAIVQWDDAHLETLEDSIAKHYVDLVNTTLLPAVHFDDRISSLSECTPNMFIAVFEAMLGVRVPGVDREPRDLATHEANMQALLDFMGEQLIGASLDHISARGICQGSWADCANALDVVFQLFQLLVAPLAPHAGGQEGDEGGWDGEEDAALGRREKEEGADGGEAPRAPRPWSPFAVNMLSGGANVAPAARRQHDARGGGARESRSDARRATVQRAARAGARPPWVAPGAPQTQGALAAGRPGGAGPARRRPLGPRGGGFGMGQHTAARAAAGRGARGAGAEEQFDAELDAVVAAVAEAAALAADRPERERPHTAGGGAPSPVGRRLPGFMRPTSAAMQRVTGRPVLRAGGGAGLPSWAFPLPDRLALPAQPAAGPRRAHTAPPRATRAAIARAAEAQAQDAELRAQHRACWAAAGRAEEGGAARSPGGAALVAAARRAAADAREAARIERELERAEARRAEAAAAARREALAQYAREARAAALENVRERAAATRRAAREAEADVARRRAELRGAQRGAALAVARAVDSRLAVRARPRA